MLKLGGTDINKLYLGSTEIKKAYLGSGLVFDNTGYDFTTGLVASWQFENNFNDYTGNHNAIKTGLVTNNTTGLVGNQADFSGSTDYLTVVDHADFSFGDGVTDVPFTMSMWVKFDSFSGAEGEWLINKRNASSTGDEWQLYYFGGVLYCTLFSSDSNANYIEITHTVSLISNTWYHISATYDGSGLHTGLKLYLDNVSVGTTFETGTYVATSNGIAPVIMGTRGWQTNGGELNGKLDEVKVYKNRELTQLEITEMYTEEVAGNSVLP